MILKNLATLTVKVEDANLALKKPDLIKKLRELTIRPGSGMNYELNNFEKLASQRQIDCKILMAFSNRKLVGWAFLSKESTDFSFPNDVTGYKPNYGLLFEVYIDPAYRRQGIASELLKTAKRVSSGDRLCICPHDYKSKDFYNQFKDIDPKIL